MSPRRCAACTAATVAQGGARRRPRRDAADCRGACRRNAATGFPASAAATSPLATSCGDGPPTAFAAGGAMIQADTANNALIIMAPEPVYNNLRAVIERLDARRAQVFVEALIVEVSADKAAEFGIQWQVLSGAARNRSGVQGFGGTNFGARGSGTNIIDASVNLGSARTGPQPRHHQRHDQRSRASASSATSGCSSRALETDTNANILSTPTLLTLDNEEARIIVGQNVPFITGQYATTGTRRRCSRSRRSSAGTSASCCA